MERSDQASQSTQTYSRRAALVAGGAAIGLALRDSSVLAQPAARPASAPFGYCLNTSTIRGAKLPIDQVIDITARAGYDAIEPWISELEEHEKRGGSLKDLQKMLADKGVAVAGAIGFAKWIVNDDAERAKALEQMKRDMDKVAQIGGNRIAAPAVGATKPEDPNIDLLAAGARYADICKLGQQTGVLPSIEVWGFSKTLTRLADAVMVALASGHPKASILSDIYHMHKGGSAFAGLRLLNGAAMTNFHVNDYPAEPAREAITDAHRVYTGDGVAPIGDILRTLRDTGFRGTLSLELFNRDYWKLPPLDVAKTGLAKMKESVAKALG